MKKCSIITLILSGIGSIAGGLITVTENYSTLVAWNQASMVIMGSALIMCGIYALVFGICLSIDNWR